MDSVEKSAKTVDLAIEEALRALMVHRDEVDIQIIDAGAKGFIGLGARPAHVKVSIKHNPEKIAETFIKEMGMAMGILIGKRGQTLDSIQHLVSLAINKGKSPYINVVVDSENYRKRRKEILEHLAHNLAKKVKVTKKPVTLEPMNTSERRIIHSALQSDRQVATYSEGADPFRNIVIAPKKPNSRQ